MFKGIVRQKMKCNHYGLTLMLMNPLLFLKAYFPSRYFLLPSTLVDPGSHKNVVIFQSKCPEAMSRVYLKQHHLVYFYSLNRPVLNLQCKQCKWVYLWGNWEKNTTHFIGPYLKDRAFLMRAQGTHTLQLMMPLKH